MRITQRPIETRPTQKVQAIQPVQCQPSAPPGIVLRSEHWREKPEGHVADVRKRKAEDDHPLSSTAKPKSKKVRFTLETCGASEPSPSESAIQPVNTRLRPASGKPSPLAYLNASDHDRMKTHPHFRAKGYVREGGTDSAWSDQPDAASSTSPSEECAAPGGTLEILRRIIDRSQAVCHDLGFDGDPERGIQSVRTLCHLCLAH